MAKVASNVQSLLTNPFRAGDPITSRILKRKNPEFLAQTDDLFSGNRFHRRALRKVGYLAPFEYERRPKVLRKEGGMG